MNSTLENCGKKYADYKQLLDHPKMLLVLASQHHAFSHPKLYSLPLGVRPGPAALIMSILTKLNETLVYPDGKNILDDREGHRVIK